MAESQAFWRGDEATRRVIEHVLLNDRPKTPVFKILEGSYKNREVIQRSDGIFWLYHRDYFPGD